MEPPADTVRTVRTGTVRVKFGMETAGALESTRGGTQRGSQLRPVGAGRRTRNTSRHRSAPAVLQNPEPRSPPRSRHQPHLTLSAVTQPPQIMGRLALSSMLRAHFCRRRTLTNSNPRFCHFSPSHTGTVATPNGAIPAGFGTRPITIELTQNSINMLDSVTQEQMQQVKFTTVRNHQRLASLQHPPRSRQRPPPPASL